MKKKTAFFLITSVIVLLLATFAVYAYNLNNPVNPSSLETSSADDATVLRSLWREYEKARDNDKPDSSAEILRKIKTKAAAQHLVYDYYKAVNEYVDVLSAKNWKQRNSLIKSRNEELKSFGEPLLLYLSGIVNKSDDSLTQFLADNYKELISSSHPYFWKNNPVPYKGAALAEYFQNDYEYILADFLFSSYYRRVNSPTYKEIYGSFLSGAGKRYPFGALYEFWKETIEYQKFNESFYLDYIGKYKGFAVSILAENKLLAHKKSEMEKNGDASSQDYRQLREEAVRVAAIYDSFKGREAIVIAEDDYAERLVNQLDAKEIFLDLEGNQLTVALRNLSSVDVKICTDADGKNEIFARSLENGTRSYYRRDSLKLTIPAISDGEYYFFASSGKIRTTALHKRCSLAAQLVTTADGVFVYLADRMSGEPVELADMEIISSGKTVASVKDVKLSGLTALPEALSSVLASDRTRLMYLRCTCAKDGAVLCTENLALSENEAISPSRNESDAVFNGHSLLDKTAFRPGEKLQFKSIFYTCSADGEMQAAPSGKQVTITLTDASGKDIASQMLLTNDFGSVASSFEIPVSGCRNGNWRISSSLEGYLMDAAWFIVDEFVLPSFSVEFENNDKMFWPGDTIPFRGRIKSYASNNLSDASITYEVQKSSIIIASGSLELDENSCFELPVSTSAKDKWAYYTLLVKITDSAGETHEFSAHKTVSSDYSLKINFADGLFTDGLAVGLGSAGNYGSYRRKEILKSDFISFGFETEDADGQSVALVDKAQYRLSRVAADGGQTTVRSGDVEKSASCNISLAGCKSGLYRLTLQTSALSSDGQSKKVEEIRELVYLSDSDKSLDAPLETVFKLLDSKSEISLLMGTSVPPVWTSISLYDSNSRLLYSTLVKLGENASGDETTTGPIVKFSLPFSSLWSGKVLLKAVYFRQGSFHSFNHEYGRQESSFAKKLSLESFSEECRPGTEYRLKINSEASTEILASIFDLSTEAIAPNQWSTIKPIYRPIYIKERNSCGVYRFGFSDIWRNSRVLYSKSAVTAGAAAEEVVSVNDAMPMVESKSSSQAATPSISADEFVHLRKDFRTVLAFEPFLKTDADGNAELSFKTSDKLSTYVISLFAHDRDMNNSSLRSEFVVKSPVNITVHEPSLLYSGDSYAMAAMLSNNSSSSLDGVLTAYFYDGVYEPASEEEIPTPILVQSVPLSLDAAASESVRLSFNAADAEKMTSWNSRSENAELSVKLVFRCCAADGVRYSDALLFKLRLMPSKQILSETHSAVYRPGMNRDELLSRLEQEFVNTSHFGASLQERKISELLDEVLSANLVPESDNAISLAKALYVNASLARDAQSKQLLEKLLACRCANGGFAWFAGMDASAIVTAVVLENLALIESSAKLDLDNSVLSDAVAYLDSSFFSSREYSLWNSSISVGQYIFVRSLFADIALKTDSIKAAAGAKQYSDKIKQLKAYLMPKASEDYLNGDIFAKARRSYSALRFRESESNAFLLSFLNRLQCRRVWRTLGRNISSLKQYAVEHQDGDIYFPNAVLPFRGLLESEVYAHSLLASLMQDWGSDENDAEALKIADGICLWLMLQKETQKWELSPESVNAVEAIRSASPSLMETSVIVLSKTFEKPFSEIAQAGNGMSIKKEYFIESKQLSRADGVSQGAMTTLRKALEPGAVLSVGDKLIVRYKIWNKENRSFVRITAPYNACLRPVKQISGAWNTAGARFSISRGFQAYREVFADRIDYYFDIYPEEESIIEDEFYISQSGVFKVPVAEIESLYAPHYRANAAYDTALIVE